MSKSALLAMVSQDRRKVIHHEEDGRKYVETRQDVTHIQEAARRLFNDNPPLDFRRVALIPDAVFDKAVHEGWLHDKAAWRKWVNDPANVGYRTTKGTI